MAVKTKKIFFHSTIVVGSLLVIGLVIFFYRQTQQAKAGEFLSSDLNQDGIVDTKDVDLIKQNYANTAGGILNPSPYDLNSDYKINSLDLAIVEDNQGNGTNPERDYDKDGWTAGQGDCDDRNYDVNPGQVEVADGKDQNCNNAIDEFVDFKHIESNKQAHLPIHYHNNSDGSVDITPGTLSIKTTDQTMTGPTMPGEFAVTLRDANKNILDQNYFSTNRIALFELTPPADGDIDLLFPINDQVAIIEINNVQKPGETKTIPVAEGLKVTHIAQAQGVDLTQCPSGISQFFMFCSNLGSYSGKVSSAFGIIASKAPELVHFRGSQFGITDEYHGYGAMPAGDILLIGSEYVESLSVNDLAVALDAMLNFNVFTAVQVSAGSVTYADHDYARLLVSQLNEYGKSLTQQNCKAKDPLCSFNMPKFSTEFKENIPRAMYESSTPLPGIEVPTWKDEVINNPQTNKSDPYGPRPQSGLGVTTVGGDVMTMFQFPALMASQFMDELNIESFKVAEDSGFFALLLDGDVDATGAKNILTGSKKYPDTSGLAKQYAILGKYGFIKDWDHDGIPDDYDNCAPKTYPGKCPIPSDPNAMNACSNSDQGDYNNNRIGDKCEFPGENMWTACLPDGGICPSPDGERLAYNSPNTPRWPINGINTILDYCSTAAPVYTGGSDHELTPQEICPSPDKK